MGGMLLAFTAFAQDRDAQVNQVLNAWHQAAAQADFDTYFGLMSPESIFVGTDATEHWGYEAFKAYAKPYFDAGRAWSFTPLQRHIYGHGDVVWFDELLDTQMGSCRGSGVLRKIDGSWKIEHYVLSLTVPNEEVGKVIPLKAAQDSLLLREYQKP